MFNIIDLLTLFHILGNVCVTCRVQDTKLPNGIPCIDKHAVIIGSEFLHVLSQIVKTKEYVVLSREPKAELISLDLPNSDADDDNFRYYKTEFTNLSSIHGIFFLELDLSSCVDIPTETFDELSKLTSLTRLNLYRTQINESGFEKITRYFNNTKLCL